MARIVPVKDVTLPRHLAAFVSTKRPTKAGEAPDWAKLEVYTGWVGFHHETGSNLVREDVVSFVLLDDKFIQPYQDEDLILDTTVTAAVSSFAGEPDTCAVDEASVGLEQNSFVGQQGSPLVLVLRAVVAASGGTIHALTYQVTVLAREREVLEPFRPPDGARPRLTP